MSYFKQVSNKATTEFNFYHTTRRLEVSRYSKLLSRRSVTLFLISHFTIYKYFSNIHQHISWIQLKKSFSVLNRGSVRVV